jgi:PPOX class probable F420-dependent enzyme
MAQHRKTEPSAMTLSPRERAFLMRRRIGHLATVDASSIPAVVPVCFAIGTDALYTALDEKPKSTPNVQRVRNIRENPHVCFVADCYDEDWSKLGWVIIRGRAEILDAGDEYRRACSLLRERYPQYAMMRLSPVIAVRIMRARAWGDLDG